MGDLEHVLECSLSLVRKVICLLMWRWRLYKIIIHFLYDCYDDTCGLFGID